MKTLFLVKSAWAPNTLPIPQLEWDNVCSRKIYWLSYGEFVALYLSARIQAPRTLRPRKVTAVYGVSVSYMEHGFPTLRTHCNIFAMQYW